MSAPFFSICIPQHNRTSFLMEVCRSIARQTLKDYEVCVSDDASSDGRENELKSFLESLSVPFIYKHHAKNQRYDANLRAAIALAKGRYCFLLGNDDALASETVLEEIHASILGMDDPGVVVTNYKDFASEKISRRIPCTCLLGKGPETAARTFRNLSFVSGVLLKTSAAKKHATDRWDGSEMYQMFLGSRIIAEGAPLLNLDIISVIRGIQIPGESVDSYAKRPILQQKRIEPKKLPLHALCRLVADAISPYSNADDQNRLAESIAAQFLTATYPYWLIEYRRVQSWRYAAGVALAARPKQLMEGLHARPAGRWRIAFLYGVSTLFGLCIPIVLFDAFYPWLYRLTKNRSGQPFRS